MVQLQDQGQSDRDLRRGHGENEDKENLPISLLPSRPSDHERQTCRVEHHLKRHENKNQVTAYEEAGQSQREQDPRQEQPVSQRYLEHVEYPFCV